MPQRIQRKRTRGWTAPAGAIYVGRSTVWENRWRVGDYSATLGREIATRSEAVELYRKLHVEQAVGFKAYIRERLRGKNLMCWCKPEDSCHADVLLEIASS